VAPRRPNGCDVASVMWRRSRRVIESERLCQFAGIVYAAARMAVTGAATDAGDATRVVESIRQHCLEAGLRRHWNHHARAGSLTPWWRADGVIVGTALVRRLLDGTGSARRGGVRGAVARRYVVTRRK